MIAGLCESPLTFQAIIIWRDELNEGKVFLRDIIDLDATYAGNSPSGGVGNAHLLCRGRSALIIFFGAKSSFSKRETPLGISGKEDLIRAAARSWYAETTGSYY